MTQEIFLDEPYLRTCEATVLSLTEDDGVILDRTIFYATGGGQPGDTGVIERSDGERLEVTATSRSKDRSQIVHSVSLASTHLQAGDKVTLHIDWAKRYKHMRIHSALHLLSVALPYPVTGGQIGEGKGRLDFCLPDVTVGKEEITNQLATLIGRDEPITVSWIIEEQLTANPNLVKTMSVKPPMGAGAVRLVKVGEDTDLQPCGGTHVSTTSEIGTVSVDKIESKGKQNKRVRISLAD
ncbi:alanyl-tRNA editing protein [Flexibacterium corallicola]|uniref:alanyl-tRNA editing protein n=1 Tax=Flexibacterium corallicola TaxID=3037259 RepID=UPI00286F564C|nr:alanyl-tRNA editing protein [Pseudovibrio sp. M1P-2-3]